MRGAGAKRPTLNFVSCQFLAMLNYATKIIIFQIINQTLPNIENDINPLQLEFIQNQNISILWFKSHY